MAENESLLEISCAPWVMHCFKDKGREWLYNLPVIIDRLSRKFSVNNVVPLNNSAYNFTAKCSYKDKQRAFLKIGFPDAGIRREAAALRALQGTNVVEILAVDEELSALFLREIKPAFPLHSQKNEQAESEIAATIIKKLTAKMPFEYEFPLLSGWFSVLKDFISSASPVPSVYITKAGKVFAELEADKKKDILLHGDLHHFNILKDADNWVIIDPKGVIGNPLYETACYMYNPSPHFLQQKDVRKTIKQRLEIFSEILIWTKEEIAAMAFCQSVLSACWCIQDGQNCWQNALYAADLFYENL